MSRRSLDLAQRGEVQTVAAAGRPRTPQNIRGARTISVDFDRLLKSIGAPAGAICAANIGGIGAAKRKISGSPGVLYFWRQL